MARRALTPAEVRNKIAEWVRIDAEVASSAGDVEGADAMRDLLRTIRRMRMTRDVP